MSVVPLLEHFVPQDEVVFGDGSPVYPGVLGFVVSAVLQYDAAGRFSPRICYKVLVPVGRSGGCRFHNVFAGDTSADVFLHYRSAVGDVIYSGSSTTLPRRLGYRVRVIDCEGDASCVENRQFVVANMHLRSFGLGTPDELRFGWRSAVRQVARSTIDCVLVSDDADGLCETCAVGQVATLPSFYATLDAEERPTTGCAVLPQGG